MRNQRPFQASIHPCNGAVISHLRSITSSKQSASKTCDRSRSKLLQTPVSRKQNSQTQKPSEGIDLRRQSRSDRPEPTSPNSHRLSAKLNLANNLFECVLLFEGQNNNSSIGNCSDWASLSSNHSQHSPTKRTQLPPNSKKGNVCEAISKHKQSHFCLQNKKAATSTGTSKQFPLFYSKKLPAWQRKRQQGKNTRISTWKKNKAHPKRRENKVLNC